MNFLLEKPLVVKHKKIAANHKRQTSPVNDFNRFFCMKDAEIWGHWNSPWCETDISS